MNLTKEINCLLNHDLLARVVMASASIIRLLQSRQKILYENFGKGFGGDISSGADLLCEAIFCKFLLPIAHVDSEESGFIASKNVTQIAVLDPLDGSSNFKSDIAYYGASIAMCDSKSHLVREALVVNFITQEISYMNEKIFALQKKPYIFRFDSSFIKDKITLGADIREICRNISQEPCGDISVALESLECEAYSQIDFRHVNTGIFEKSANHHKLIKSLSNRHIKFRTLGASALSLGFSFRHLFVLLPRFIRKYDGMAGLYLSLGQNILGDLHEYYDYIPMLKECEKDTQYIIISRDTKVIEELLALIDKAKN